MLASSPAALDNGALLLGWKQRLARSISVVSPVVSHYFTTPVTLAVSNSCFVNECDNLMKGLVHTGFLPLQVWIFFKPREQGQPFGEKKKIFLTNKAT